MTPSARSAPPSRPPAAEMPSGASTSIMWSPSPGRRVWPELGASCSSRRSAPAHVRPSFYLRVKGETEEALAALGYPALHIFRPGLLLGHRAESRPRVSQEDSEADEHDVRLAGRALDVAEGLPRAFDVRGRARDAQQVAAVDGRLERDGHVLAPADEVEQNEAPAVGPSAFLDSDLRGSCSSRRRRRPSPASREAHGPQLQGRIKIS